MEVSGIVYGVRVVAVKEEVAGVKTITVVATDGRPFVYVPGQFITLVFERRGEEERRSYSVSSMAVDARALSFTVKRIDNGIYSRQLTDRTKVGDVLYTTGVGGLFVLPPDIDRYKQVFFFAAGIGITPMLPMIAQLLHHHKQIAVRLIYSNTTAQTTAFIDELKALQEDYPSQLQIEFLMSTAFMLSRARLNKELIPLLLKEYSVAAAADSLYYICGPHAYMRMVNYRLEELGVDKAHIKRELFTAPKAMPVVTPPDTGSYTATVLLNNNRYEFEVKYPDTILLAAKKLRIALPYSCEAGRCGSCVAKCTTGKVWHDYNEMLTDKELQQGKVLTCTAHPYEGDVVIDIR